MAFISTLTILCLLLSVNTQSGSLSALQNQYKLSWYLNKTTQELSLTMRANTTGWIAFGFEDMNESSIVNSDVYIGVVGIGTVLNYDLLSKEVGCDRELSKGVCVNVNGSALIYDSWNDVVDGWASFGFRRLMRNGVNFDVLGGEMRIVVAYGTEKEIEYHGEERRARLSVNLFDTVNDKTIVISETAIDETTRFASSDDSILIGISSEEVDLPEDSLETDEISTGDTEYIIYLRIIHASAMSIGWLLLHLGSLFARFGKEYPNNTWFRAHRAFQTIGYLLAMIGFGWIISAKVIEKDPIHFDQPLFHGLGGVIIMSASTIQVIFACLRPKKEENGEGSFFRKAWEWKHHILGRFALIGGTVVIGIGIYNLVGDFVNIYFGFYAGVTFSIILLTSVLECGKCCSTRVTHNYQMINL